jgi:hypothetical protein
VVGISRQRLVTVLDGGNQLALREHIQDGGPDKTMAQVNLTNLHEHEGYQKIQDVANVNLTLDDSLLDVVHWAFPGTDKNEWMDEILTIDPFPPSLGRSRLGNVMRGWDLITLPRA